MTSEAWCPTCHLVDHADDDWRCLWCGTVTLGSLNPLETRESRTLTITQLLAAHERYARGESLQALARSLYTGRDTLKQNFWAAGLPTRTPAASNALEAPRRRVTRQHGPQNAAYRRDLDDQAIANAYRRHKSLRLTALEFGCGIATVHRRLAILGHPRAPIGRNQHSESPA